MMTSDKPLVIGILGGTFDPIHIGHLRMAMEVQTALELSRIHFIPCYQPVHKYTLIASPEHRMNMLKLAIQNESSWVADPREIEHASPNYTIDTLGEFRSEFPDTSLCLCIGSDAFLDLANWKDSHQFRDLAHIVVAERPSFQLPEIAFQSDISYIHQHLAGGLLRVPISALDISASNIRKQIAMGQNPRYLLPDSVYDYIRENELYET